VLIGFFFAGRTRVSLSGRPVTTTRARQVRLSLKVNSKTVSLDVPSGATLLSVLRDNIGLTGTKKGCGTGECGACTVIVDGEAVCSCIYPAFQAAGRQVITIEGLQRGDELKSIQRAFVEVGAIQCGYCSPGAILSAWALLEKNPDPSDEEIKRAISGNLCRCTGYAAIVEAIRAAANPPA
jgi:carbon-monoxide dehydrogenase small subunit